MIARKIKGGAVAILHTCSAPHWLCVVWKHQ